MTAIGVMLLMNHCLNKDTVYLSAWNNTKYITVRIHKTILVFYFQQYLGMLAFSSDTAGLQTTDKDKVKSTDI